MDGIPDSIVCCAGKARSKGISKGNSKQVQLNSLHAHLKAFAGLAADSQDGGEDPHHAMFKSLVLLGDDGK